ncbi:MAG: 16S rRNA (guanine(966)-N(2))-methyltransferase RsmD [Pelistega sp.]|nr:16S rRNA (guanine(966)-N(2))-methyltransferase RsmD [Pelistega sp.]
MKKTLPPTPTKKTNTPQKVRIIGGDLRRTLIPVADIPGLRPTPDRVRETLFNWIHHLWQGQYHDKSVLDLFAGSGALGFEAASRGVAHVQMVESHPKALQNLRESRDKLKLEQVRIHSHDALLVLSRMDASRFDLVMLDPPFNTDLLAQVKPYLTSIVKSGGLIYIESEQKQTLDGPFELIRESKAGMVFFHLFEHISDD